NLPTNANGISIVAEIQEGLINGNLFNKICVILKDGKDLSAELQIALTSSRHQDQIRAEFFRHKYRHSRVNAVLSGLIVGRRHNGRFTLAGNGNGMRL